MTIGHQIPIKKRTKKKTGKDELWERFNLVGEILDGTAPSAARRRRRIIASTESIDQGPLGRFRRNPLRPGGGEQASAKKSRPRDRVLEVQAEPLLEALPRVRGRTPACGLSRHPRAVPSRVRGDRPNARAVFAGFLKRSSDSRKPAFAKVVCTAALVRARIGKRVIQGGWSPTHRCEA